MLASNAYCGRTFEFNWLKVWSFVGMGWEVGTFFLDI